MSITYLTDDKKSWIIVYKNAIPSTEKRIEKINKDMPTEYHKIMMMGIIDLIIPFNFYKYFTK